MPDMKLPNITSALLAVVVLTLFSAGVQASVVNTLTSGPNTDILCRTLSAGGSSPYVQNCWRAAAAANGKPSDAEILSYFDSLNIGFNSADELYRIDYATGTESGAANPNLVNSYHTDFEQVPNNSGKVENATIYYDGGPKVDCTSLTSPCFVLIQGDQNPYAYLFNLALGWDSSATVGDGNGWASTAISTPSWDGGITDGVITALELMNFGQGKLGSITQVALYGNISAVPVPAAFWLFGTALIGFIGLSRRTQI